jgi:hypothetical protein
MIVWACSSNGEKNANRVLVVKPLGRRLHRRKECDWKKIQINRLKIVKIG